jgi:D-glycero-D-manno-heptose 1,7-bisphosphate phosphatase
MTKKMLAQIKKHKAAIDGVFYCVHQTEDDCECRKPKPGLLHQAIQALGKKPDISLFVGDSFIDMKTAKAFGAKTVLVFSGKEKISNRKNWEFEPDYIFDNLLIAAHYICSHYG